MEETKIGDHVTSTGVSLVNELPTLVKKSPILVE